MRITLAAVPAYGHVLPLVPLALDAARAGHEVTFAASDEFSGRLPVDMIENVPRGMALHDAEQEALGEIATRVTRWRGRRRCSGSSCRGTSVIGWWRTGRHTVDPTS